MRDRTQVALLAVVTVPLAWYAIAGMGDDDSASQAASPRPAAATSAPTSSAPPSAGPSSSSPPSTAASASPSADPPVVPRGDGRPVVVPGTTTAAGTGDVQRYSVAVEGGLGIDPVAFAAEVDRTLADPRSWRHTGKIAFQRVDSGPVDVAVVLASPDTTDRLCRPLDTAGIYSCGNGKTAVLNSMRWLKGADAYAGRLAEYRQYVVNHEVGHTVGHGHDTCHGAGQLAPVMMQQTKGVGACLPSPWPFPDGA